MTRRGAAPATPAAPATGTAGPVPPAADSATPAMPASPCDGTCTIDDSTGWCRGCGRTIDEIVRWGASSAAERAAVLAVLPARRAARARAG